MSGRGRGLRRTVAAFAFVLASGPEFAAHAAGADDVAYARATALARTGHCPEALAVLAEIATPTAQSVNLRAQCQLDAKDWPAALASLEEAKRLDPATPGVELHLAVARFHMGDYAGAREALDLAAPTSQDDPQYHLYRGLVLLQAAQSEEAAAELGRARSLGPSAVEPGASYYEGLAWAGAEESEKARESLDRVIQSAPGTAWAAEAERAKADLARMKDARGKVWGFASAGLEYDTNVPLLADQVVPDNKANGTDGERNTHDMRAVWELYGGAQLLSGPGWAAGISGTYYGTAQFDLTEFNEHYPVLGLWYDQRVAEATSLRLTYEAGYAWFQYDPFVFNQTIRASLFHDFGEAGRTELFATPYYSDYLYSVENVQDAAAGAVPDVTDCPTPPGTDFICGPNGLNESLRRDRDGWGITTGLEHRYLLAIAKTELTGGVSYLQYISQGTEYTYRGVGTWFGTDTELPFDAAFRTTFGYAYSGYRYSSTYPDPQDPALDAPTKLYVLHSAHRHDHQLGVVLELEKYITDAWSVSARYSYTEVDSNVDVFGYTREIVGAYVTYRLKR